MDAASSRGARSIWYKKSRARTIGPATSCGEPQPGPLGADLAAVDIDRVTHRLEGVERDAYGQRDVPVHPTELPAERGRELPDRLPHEVEVFEVAEHSEIRGHRNGQDPFAAGRVLFAVEQDACEIIDLGRGQDQPDQPEVVADIKIIARRQHQHGPRDSAVLEGPEDRENDQEEPDELDRIERHGRWGLARFRSGCRSAGGFEPGGGREDVLQPVESDPVWLETLIELKEGP